MDPEESVRAPRRQELLEAAIDAFAWRFNKVVPAAVQSWDPDKRMVSVKPLIRLPHYDEEGNRQTDGKPVVNNVPLIFPGAGFARVTFPISDGTLVVPNVNNDQPLPATTGILFYSDRSLDKWLSGQGQEVDPEFDHTHHDADGIFQPGLNPFGAMMPGVANDLISIGFDNGMQIRIRGDLVAIGDELGNDWIAKSGLVGDVLSYLKSALNSAGVTAGPSPGGLLKADLMAALNVVGDLWPQSVAAEQGKVK